MFNGQGVRPSLVICFSDTCTAWESRLQAVPGVWELQGSLLLSLLLRLSAGSFRTRAATSITRASCKQKQRVYQVLSQLEHSCQTERQPGMLVWSVGPMRHCSKV